MTRRFLFPAALCACVAALPLGRARAASPAGEPPADRDHVWAAEDPHAHRHALEELRGRASAESLSRALEATRREAGRTGFASAMGPGALAPLVGNSWVNLGPTGSAADDYGAGRITDQAGRVSSIVPHPANPDVLYVATAGGGVWKTSDARATVPHWEPLTDNLGSLAVGALAMDPSAPEVLYLGLGDTFYQEEPGITYSLDGGSTWAAPRILRATYTVAGAAVTRIALSVRAIAIDPNDSAHVLAATDAGLFESHDAGHGWAQVQLADGGGTVKPYEIWSIAWTGGSNWLVTGASPVSTATTVVHPGDLGLWRSTDGGASWQWSNAALPTQTNLGRATFAVAPGTVADPATSRVFMLVSARDETNEQQRDLFRSDDGGATFISLGVNASRAPTNPARSTTISDPGFSQLNLDLGRKQADYNQAIVVDPRDPDTLFIGGQVASARSKDGGATWSLMTHGYPFAATRLPYAHPDFHAMAIAGAPGTAVLWLGTDGGLSRSTDAFTAADNQAHFDDGVNQGIVTLEPYSVACAPETWPAALQGFVLGGTQDNGTRVRSGTTTLFDDVIGGDGTGVAVSLDTVIGANGPKPLAMLGGPFATILRSEGGGSWSRFMDGLGGAAPPEIVPYAVDQAAADPQTFLTLTAAPDSAAYRSIGGNPWTKLVGVVHDLVSNDTRTTFPKAGASLSPRALTAYAKTPGVYAVVSNRFSFMTADGGANWYTGNNVGLDPSSPPPAPQGAYALSGISFDPSDATFKTAYVTSRAYQLLDGTPVPDSYGHLFKTTDRGLSWKPVVGTSGAMLPNVPATGVLVDPNDATGQTLYVATRAGLYKSADAGQHFARFGTGLPLAEVSGMCLSPASSRLTVSLWGRGFWSIDTSAYGNPAGVRGNGDLNHHQRLDGFDLIDLAATLGTTQSDDRYRWEADMAGSVNRVDDADLGAFLSRFGGAP